MNKPIYTPLREQYIAPQVEMTEVTVETGFAGSGTGENSSEEDYDQN